MRATLRIYWRLLVAGFQRRSRYRAAMLAGVLTNSMFGLIRGAILVATMTAAGGSLAGYSPSSMSTYNWFTQAMLGPLNIWGSQELGDRVRSGDIAVDLARPIDPQLAMLCEDIGSALAAVLPRTLPTLLVGAITFGLALPRMPLTWLLGVVSFGLALVISYLSRFVMQLWSFWVVEIRGIAMLYAGFSGLLGGLILPIHIMPPWLQGLAYATPFPSMLQSPVDIFSGYRTGTDVVPLLVTQCAWTAGLFAIGRAMFAAGRTKLVVQGG